MPRPEDLSSREMNVPRGLVGQEAAQLRQSQDDQPAIVSSLPLVPESLMFLLLLWGSNLNSGSQEEPRPEKMTSKIAEQHCGWGQALITSPAGAA